MGIYEGNFDLFFCWKRVLQDLKKAFEKKKRWRGMFRMNKTYYDILGVPEDASIEEIKKAYRDQIRFFHPDVFEGSPEIANEKAAELNEAYRVLSNPEERAKYDYWLKIQRIKKRTEQQRAKETANKESQNNSAGSGEKAKEDDGEPVVSETVEKKGATGKNFTKIGFAVITFIVAVLICSDMLASDKIRDIQERLDESHAENEEIKQEYEWELEQLNAELLEKEESSVSDYYYFIESAAEMAFYKQAYDHYSILTNSLNLIATFPTLFTQSDNAKNANNQLDLLSLTMQNTSNLYTTYCEDCALAEEMEVIMDDLEESSRVAIECINALKDNGISRTVTARAKESYENCNEMTGTVSHKFWNIFYDTQD